MPPNRSLKLRAECANCCALCCVGPAFDAEQGFGFDKRAHIPCINLRRDFRCGIHDRLRPLGFPSCASFDCYGAGQRVTRLFGGVSWRSAPELAVRMFDAYSRYRSMHELLAQLELAIEQVMSQDACRLVKLRDFIDQLCESGRAMDRTIRIHRLQKYISYQIRAFLGRPSDLSK